MSSVTESLPGSTYDPEFKQGDSNTNKNRKNDKNKAQWDNIDSKSTEDYFRELDVNWEQSAR
ncbi:7684_t:CDS:2, partial [Dentiscutata heterogama]